MKCPFCGKSESQVLESRIVENGNALRRRRECIVCKKRFTTYEKVKENFLWVIKKDGRREPFDREKVKRGILKAIEKRPVSLELIDDIVESIEREMLTYEKEEITSRMVGKAVLRSLKKIDKVAWLRFASVYLEFEDLKDFEKAIEKGL
ncbi:transcriptional regulator NrdR [Candidatus Woesebacteria bacterium RBG_16_36_11]|uniref:Transcriptional repressor NrdR n=3 Tax=Candidatus Woeseibacteriota TaxID=1752722 RepID=A0A1F7X804_9BACT|nr:MAG: transcriptional regulator NrdR [Candidatus Woesebacteria bacterium RBG_13_36_22]OGM11101.1 MAG: transcriptional regulator NrdR [Candidatus Woesebacteria bacterium RBG_16_36_11]